MKTAIDSHLKRGRFPRKTAFNMLDTVDIKVGTEGSTYSAHSDVLRKRSRFFANAMKPEWSGPLTSRPPIDLTDEEPAVFEIFLHWLYFRTIPTIAEDQENAEVDAEFYTLSKCYVLGEKIMAIGFKNAVLTALVDAKSEPSRMNVPCPGEPSVTIIYEGTPENSPARSLLVEMWARYATAEWEPVLDKMPSAFKSDLIRTLVNNRDVCSEKINTVLYWESATPSES